MTGTPPLSNPDGNSATSYATTVIGTADHLTNLIGNHRAAGTLLAVGRPVPVPYQPGHYQLRMRIQHRPPNRQPTRAGQRAAAPRRASTTPDPRRLRRAWRIRVAVILTTLTGTCIGLTAVAAYLLGHLVEVVTAHRNLLLGLAVVILLLVAALARAGACPGMHCPGCRHH